MANLANLAAELAGFPRTFGLGDFGHDKGSILPPEIDYAQAARTCHEIVNVAKKCKRVPDVDAESIGLAPDFTPTNLPAPGEAGGARAIWPHTRR
jgi:hypothetical protein